MKLRTFGFSLITLALAGMASGVDAKPPAYVAFETSMGNFTLELNQEKAPVTTANFLSYVKDGFYDGSIFHRVIGNFMIQGGGFELVDGTGSQKKTKAPIVNEAKNGLKNVRYAISMARTNAPDSATTQFFINVKDNPGLDPKTEANPAGFTPDGYAVFGKVVKGEETIEKIKGVKTGVKQLKARDLTGQLRPQPMRDVPLENVVIKSAKVLAKAPDLAPTPKPATPAPEPTPRPATPGAPK